MRLFGLPFPPALLACCLAVSCHGSLPGGPLPKELAGDELQLHEVLETIQSDSGLLWHPEAGHVRQLLAFSFHETATDLEQVSKEELKERLKSVSSPEELPPDLKERSKRTYDMGLLVGTLECSAGWSRKNRIDRDLMSPLFKQILLDAVCGPPGKKCVRLHYYWEGLHDEGSMLGFPNPYVASRSEVESFFQKILAYEKVFQRPFYSTLHVIGRANDFEIYETRFTDRYRQGSHLNSMDNCPHWKKFSGY